MKKIITLIGTLALLFTISSFTSNPASVQDGGDDIM
ncbi:MAG: hypothetical protein ACJA19_001670, partial [Bacteroidia bacterium]